MHRAARTLGLTNGETVGLLQRLEYYNENGDLYARYA